MELTAVERLRVAVKGVEWPEAEGIVFKAPPYRDLASTVPYLDDFPEYSITAIANLFNRAKWDRRIKNAEEYFCRARHITPEQLGRALAYHREHDDLFRLARNPLLGKADLAEIYQLLVDNGLA